MVSESKETCPFTISSHSYVRCLGTRNRITGFNPLALAAVTAAAAQLESYQHTHIHNEA